MTRAPSRSAMAREPSVLPLSATTISPSTPLASRKRRALAMHAPIVSASSRHGMTMESSGVIGDTLPNPPEDCLVQPRVVEDFREARVALERELQPLLG